MSPSLDTLLAAADPAPDQALRALDHPEVVRATDALKEAIVAEPQRPAAGNAPARRSLRRRLPVLVAASTAIAVAGVLGYASLGRIDGVTPSSSQAWAASAVRVAETVPRRLVGEPGWRVIRADQFTVGEGEMTFAKGNRRAELRWTTQSRSMLLADRAMSSDLGDRHAKVGGADATLFHYAKTKDDFAAIWADGSRYTMELRTNASPQSLVRNADGSQSYAQGYRTGFTLASFTAMLTSIRAASVDDWLGAMPGNVVKPQDTSMAIAAILDDIPQPPGFKPWGLIANGTVHDRYQLGARVTGAVACGWIESWIAAKASGDEAKQEEAIRALEGSKSWAITKEMEPDGAYPSVITEYAQAMRSGGSPPAGRKTTVEASYRNALGCDGP